MLLVPKNSSGVGFSFSFLEKGAWSESGRTVPVPCPSRAGSSRFLALVYAKRSFFGKCRSRLRETDILLAPIRPAALSSTRNGHFNIKYRSRLRETVPWPSPESSRALSSTRNGHFNIKSRSRLRETVRWPSFGSSVALSSMRNCLT